MSSFAGNKLHNPTVMKIVTVSVMNINPSEVVDDDNNHHHRGYHQKFCRCKHNQRAYDYLLVKAIQLKQNDYNINIKLGLMKAAKSVLKYPLPILSEEEALLLNGVGKTIAKEIMKALSFGSCPTVAMNVDGGGDDDDGNIASTMNCMSNRSCDDNQHSCIKDVTEVEENHSSRRQQQVPQSLVPTTHSSTTHTLISHASTVEDSLYRNSSISQLSINNSTRKYIPEFGKVPWTILIALYRLGGNANKAQIETEVFELNRTHDFIHADSYRDTRYPSLSILKKKGLIEEVSPTGHLWLTETGTGIAIEQHVIFLRRSTPIVSTVTTIASTTTTTTSAVLPALPSSNSVTDDHNEDPSVGDTSSINCDDVIVIGEKDHDVDYNSNRMYARSNSISYNSSNGYHRGNNCNDDEDRYVAKRDHPTAIAVWSDVGKSVQHSYLLAAIRRPTCEVVDLCSPPMVSNSHVNTDNITEDRKQYQYRSQSLAYNKHSLDPNRSPHTPLPVRPCRIMTPSFVSIPLIAIEDDHRYDGGAMNDHRYDGDAMDDHRYDGGAMDDRHDGHYGGDASSYDDEVMICYPPLQDDVRCTVESYQTRLMRTCRDENHNEGSDDAPRTVTVVREHSIAAGSDPTSRLIDYRARMDIMKEERNSGGVVDLTLDDSSADEAHGDDGDDDMMELHIGKDQSSSRNLCSIDSNAAAVSPSPSSTSTATTVVRSLFSHVISARPLHEEYIHTASTHTNCIDIDIDIINPHDDDRGMCNDKDAITDDRGNVPVVNTGCHSSGSLFSMLASKHKQFLEARAGQAAIPPSLSSSVASSSVVGMERSMTSAAASSTDKEEIQKENVHSNIVGVLNTSKARKRSTTTTTTTTTTVTARNNKSHKEAQAATAVVDRTIIMNGSSAIVSNAIVAAGTTYIEGDLQTRSGEGPVGRSYYQQKQLLPLSSLHACDWEVVLLIDKRERSNALIQGKMVANGVPSELCNLAVGDFLWVVRPAFVSSYSSNRRDPTTTTTITTSCSSSSTTTTTTTTIVSPTAADSSSVDMVVPITCGQDRCEEEGSMSSTHNQSTHNSNHTNNNNHNDNHHNNGKSSSSNGLNNSHNYFVLDCVAERKTIADLASSISDGRYIEQKSRLKACNLRSTIYIIEGEHIVVPTQQRAITAASIKTAIVSINVDNDMNVLRTRGIDHTITCLLTIHRQVQRRFIKTLPSCPMYQPFPQFQQMFMKQGASTNKQLFGFQLRQIHGCSTAVAMILMEIYGTTANFMHELHKMGPLRAEFTLTNLKRYGTCKKIGPMLSKRICRVYLDKY